MGAVVGPEVFSVPPSDVLLAAFAAYLLGSVAFGLIIARAMNLGDPTKIGSGNIGTTNVLRTGSKTAAVLTLLLDSGKGAAAVAIGTYFGGGTGALVCGLAAFVGHLYPIWRRFRGGKGVATFLGVLLAVAFPIGAAVCAIWLLVAAIFRFSSLASLSSAVLSVPCLWALGQTQAIPFVALMTVMICWSHRGNIKRLLDGTESRIDLQSAQSQSKIDQ